MHKERGLHLAKHVWCGGSTTPLLTFKSCQDAQSHPTGRGRLLHHVDGMTNVIVIQTTIHPDVTKHILGQMIMTILAGLGSEVEV